MFSFESFDINLWQWAILMLCAVLVGVSKTGIPGVGILVVPMVASVLPAKVSVGVLLPMLIFADLFAGAYYRRNAQWGHIFRLLPWTVLGIIAGYFVMGKINDNQLKPIIGIIVLIMLALGIWSKNKNIAGGPGSLTYKLFAVLLGFTAGLTTMMANAAGPVMIIYLLVVGLPKIQFVGTMAWFFLIVNWIKVPFIAKLNLITAESLKLDLCLFPLIIAGAALGIYCLKRIPQKIFNIVVVALAAAAAIKLLF